MNPPLPAASHKAYQAIRTRLQAGDYPPATQLVNRTLAKELGTSTIPVRDAINRLVSEGLLEYVPGTGAFVRRPNRRELAQLYDIREALEPLAAAEAARHASGYEVAELADLCDRWQRLADEVPAAPAGHATADQMRQWADGEERFHQAVAEAAHNPRLAKMLSEVRLVGSVFAAQRAAPGILTAAVAAATAGDHRRLVGFLEQRDPAAAQAWMAAHIRRGRETVLAFFDAAGPSTAGDDSHRG